MAEPNPTQSASKHTESIPYWQLVLNQGILTDRILNHEYNGSGTEENPYLVNWIQNDPRNPMEWPRATKWTYTMLVAFATLAVALVSSAFSGGLPQILQEFKISSEVGTLGLSLFVVGFAIGPLLWAPLSEMYGRQLLFFVSYAGLTAFNAGAAGSQNPWTLIILRFFAGAFGSSPLTNAGLCSFLLLLLSLLQIEKSLLINVGGVIADMFPASERGLAMTLFASAPFLGPTIGPVIGGFCMFTSPLIWIKTDCAVGMNAGWRWVMGFLAAFSGVLWIVCSVFVPETYGPVLLQKRAASLSKHTGEVYVSIHDAEKGKISIKQAFKTSLLRPWILLFREPIVLLLSIYMAIIYGTLYLCFGAFPIVFQGERHWNQGVAGLAFLGVMIGMIIAVPYSIIDNKRYVQTQGKHAGFAPPEARLPPCLVGSIAVPIGLFWFAWTTFPSVHWVVPIIASAPFGFGMVLVFLSIMNYLIDSYTIYAASVLAANSVLRSLFGAAFPLFTSQMYANLGTQWASSVPAFLALGCVPFPFLFYKYGPAIRKKCKFAAESDAFMRKMAERMASAADSPDDNNKVGNENEKDGSKDIDLEAGSHHNAPDSHTEVESSAGSNLDELHGVSRKQSIPQSVHSRNSSVYEGNP